jgi:hypothetical protein
VDYMALYPRRYNFITTIVRTSIPTSFIIYKYLWEMVKIIFDKNYRKLINWGSVINLLPHISKIEIALILQCNKKASNLKAKI